MRYLIAMVLLVLAGTAVAQDYSADDAYLRRLDAQSFYQQTGLTPGDYQALSPAQRRAVVEKMHCDTPHRMIDEQLALEKAGHVGMSDWRYMRQLEKQDCPMSAWGYRSGISRLDPYGKQ